MASNDADGPKPNAPPRRGLAPELGEDGERRQATVLFADLVGFTAFSEQFGDEAAYRLAQRLSALMTEAVHEHGGTIKSFTGDGVMALFGVPHAMEDAPLRACRAALAIHHKIAEAAPEFESNYGRRPEVRIGINTGSAVIGTVQSGESTGITALGDTVNFAARLQALADPGGTMLSETAYHLVGGLVESHPAGDHSVKGKAERQRIYRLIGIRESATRFDTAITRGLTTYIGRDRELEALERCFSEARTNLRVIDIVGEPGIGKSRLLYEFRRRIGQQHGHILSGSCSPDGQETAFLPFIEVIRRSFHVSVGETDAAVGQKLESGLCALEINSRLNTGLLLNLLGLKPPHDALRGLDGTLVGLRTRELLLALLQARCRLGTTVLLLEDLHWIDSVSEQLLGRIVELETPLPLLVIQTRRPEYRPPWAGRPQVMPLELKPLSAEYTSRIVEARLGVGQIPERLNQLIIDKAEGNALFAEEIASYLHEHGIVRRTASGLSYDPATATTKLPGTIEMLLTARVDRLDAGDRALLQAAAVIGRRFDPDLLREVVGGHRDVGERLNAIQGFDLVHPIGRSGEFAFKHALVRDALYNSLLSDARCKLHGKIADEIERRSGNRLTEVTEVLAHHFEQAKYLEKAFTYLALAGKKSLGIYSLDEAETYLERASAIAESSPKCAEDVAFTDMIADLTSLYHLKLLPTKLVSVVDRHMTRLQGASDLPQTVIVLSNYVIAAMEMSRWHAMSKEAERSLAIAERLNDDRSKAYGRANWILAKCLLGQSSLKEAERQIEAALAESERVDDPHLQFLVLWACAWDCFQRGLTDRGREFGREMQERGRRRNDPRALAAGLWVIAWFDLVDERYDDMFAHAAESLRTAITPQDREVAELLVAMAITFRGEIAEGVNRLWNVRERCIKAGWTYITSATDMPLGVAMVLQGHMAAGVQFLERLIVQNHELGFIVGRDMSRLLLAEIYIAILEATQRPSLSVILTNIRFLVQTKLFGWNKALALLIAARDNVMFSETSHWRARTEANLGFLYAIKRRYAEASDCLKRARPIAAKLQATTLLAKIDASIAKLPS
jgi:class 3 adenylate cyclase